MKERDFKSVNAFRLILSRCILIPGLIVLFPTNLLSEGNGGSGGDSIITLMQVIGLLGSLATIILGFIAIWLSLYFYRRTNELNNAVNSKLSTIEVSSKMTETTSVNILRPVIETIMGVFRQSTISGFDNIKSRYISNIAAEIEKLSSAQSDDEKKMSRDAILHELNSLIGTFKNQIEKINIPSSTSQDTKYPEDIYYGWSRAYWMNFIQRIDKLESEKEFLSVKWLREKLFGNDLDSQQILQAALDKNILLKYYLDNKKRPEFPTLACKLDRNNFLVKYATSGDAVKAKDD